MTDPMKKGRAAAEAMLIALRAEKGREYICRLLTWGRLFNTLRRLPDDEQGDAMKLLTEVGDAMSLDRTDRDAFANLGLRIRRDLLGDQP